VRCRGSLSRSCPFRRMAPRRRRRMPMTALSVVVLPAPLRPSSVTVSPSRTPRSTPRSPWLSPYQPCRSRTSSSGAARSVMLGSHIGLAHPLVLADGCIGSLREDLAAGQDRDPVAQVGDHIEIVLDHEHGAVAGDAPHEVG